MVDERIVKFIKSHHVLTLATGGEEPYCSNAFYCYDAERNIFIFTASLATRHAKDMEVNSKVAASIVLETRIIGRVEGLQLCGEVCRGDDKAKTLYLKRFPYAALMELTIWMLEPSFMKFTDNTLGFGTKLIWNR